MKLMDHKEFTIARDDKNKNLLFEAHMYMSPKMIHKKRISDGMFAILSEVGGILKILQVVFSIICYPISNYLFLLIIIKRLYFAKTKEDGIFLKD